MPSEQQPSQSQGRPAHGNHRSTSSIHSQTDSPSTTPPQHAKSKTQKHVVGGGRTHARVPSSKALHKLTKAHINEGSQTDLKKLGRNSSTTSLKKNSSHVTLKRNRSSADVSKRPKSSHGPDKRPASVHFEIGDQEDDAGWEEASSSASPALSRSASRSVVSSGQLSSRPTVNNLEPPSPSHSSVKSGAVSPHSSPKNQTRPTNGSNEKQSVRSTNAKVITERLLQRTHSHHNPTKMSLATATPSGHSPESLDKSQSSTLNGTPKTGSSGNEMVSRFVGGSGTPSENSHFFQTRKSELQQTKKGADEVKRAQSMGNLTRRDSERDDEEESALAPRSRKSSTTHAYVPPQQSRTQQKLWLQRASSNIEPQQMAPGVAVLHGGLGATPLLGTGYDGRDPRIKLQLERTGLEYLVVRRHQDPVGLALKRLGKLPGAEKNRRIPSHHLKKGDVNADRYGLSQTLKESKNREKNKSPTTNTTGSSYDGQSGSQDDTGISDRGQDDDGVGAVLRSLWEKNFDLSASAD